MQARKQSASLFVQDRSELKADKFPSFVVAAQYLGYETMQQYLGFAVPAAHSIGNGSRDDRYWSFYPDLQIAAIDRQKCSLLFDMSQ